MNANRVGEIVMLPFRLAGARARAVTCTVHGHALIGFARSARANGSAALDRAYREHLQRAGLTARTSHEAR